MPVEAQMMVGPIGPDTIRIPGEPQRLRRAADALGELCQQLDDIGSQLRNADADEGRRGRTVRSLSRVAGRTGRVLQSDADTLQQLADAVQREADLLAEAHATLDDLRATWRGARQELRDAVDGEQARRRDHGPDAVQAKGQHEADPVDVRALIRGVDGDVADQHEAAISRLSGIHFAGGEPRGPQAMVLDGEIDRAVSTYRRQVDRVLDELTETMRRVQRADENLADLLHRDDTRVAVAHEVDADDSPAEDANVISGPEDIRAVAEQVQQSARSLERASDQLRDIRLGIREGRMLPDEDRVGSSDGFQRSWTQHFDELREDLDHARRAGADVATRLAQLDQDGARDVRRSGRREG